MNTRASRRLVAVLTLTVVAGATACSSASAPSPEAPAATGVPDQRDVAESMGSVPATARPVDGRTTNVQARGAKLVVRSEPDDRAPVITTLEPKTELGSRTTLLVEEARPGWFRVALPIRPNGSSGWVKASEVAERDNTLSVTVDLAARRLIVTDGDRVVLQSTVAVGAAATPTPTGRFFVTDLLENDDPRGAYGPFAIGLSAHSETITEFAGGDGQIGIHGTNDPSSIGKAVSHGCVRLPNETITQLANLLPLGTPVTIV